MKIRNDFVSNSSSCSFIVKVNNADDIAKVRELIEKHSSSQNSICCGGYCDIAYASENSWDYDQYINENNVEPGELLKIDVGEDHDEETIRKFYDVSSDFEESGLELYADDDAHCTVGKALSEKDNL